MDVNGGLCLAVNFYSGPWQPNGTHWVTKEVFGGPWLMGGLHGYQGFTDAMDKCPTAAIVKVRFRILAKSGNHLFQCQKANH